MFAKVSAIQSEERLAATMAGVGETWDHAMRLQCSSGPSAMPEDHHICLELHSAAVAVLL